MFSIGLMLACPPLQVGEHAVHPMQDLVRLRAGDDLGLMGVRGRVLMAEPAVLHADTARLPVIGQFHCTDHEHLADRTAPALRSIARIVLRAERHFRFVDFHKFL